MGDVKDLLLAQVRDEAARFVEAEQELNRRRDRLHAVIRAAGSDALVKAERSGPSALARATGHRYTREYISTLLKTKVEARAVMDELRGSMLARSAARAFEPEALQAPDREPEAETLSD